MYPDQDFADDIRRDELEDARRDAWGESQRAKGLVLCDGCDKWLWGEEFVSYITEQHVYKLCPECLKKEKGKDND